MNDKPVYIGIAQVKARYGGVSRMWVERRLKDGSGFPKPVKFGGHERFWKVDDLEAWERRVARKCAS